MSHIEDALAVWAPTFPRRVNKTQEWANDADEAAHLLRQAQDNDFNRPYLSVYSFPRGHTKDGNIPRIDTLFIDFDFEGGEYDPDDPDYQAWRRDMSHLLVRVRRVASFLAQRGNAGWRAALSGHKGVHLFLDFPAVGPDAGSFQQFIAGLDEYAQALVDGLAEETGISDLQDYVDVTSSDLGRLCRVPNTQHGAASNSLGEARYCVPVTLEELAQIDVDEYERLTREPRAVPYDSRDPNTEVGTNVEQHIVNATPTTHSAAGSRYGGSSRNMGRVQRYREQSNDKIDLDDIKFLTSDRPCIWEFYKRDDKWDYGDQSHAMEVFCIDELRRKNVPIGVIKDFLNSAPGYDEAYSEEIIKEVIARDYDRTNIETLQRKAPEFCAYDHCSLCKRVAGECGEGE